jgi:hypothetical protein
VTLVQFEQLRARRHDIGHGKAILGCLGSDAFP